MERSRLDVSRILMTAGVVALSDWLFAEILYVPLLHKTTTLRLWQGLAVSLLGKDAMTGGLSTWLLGVCIHVGVAFGWTLVFVIAYNQSEAVRRAIRSTTGAVAASLLYGAFIWLMMQFVIVPLTRITQGPINWLFYVQLLWHPIGIAAPIVFLTRRK